jgi:hypothetical protein
MRIFLLTFLVVLVSCGQSKNNSTKNSVTSQQNEEFATNVKEVDLLDVALDVPVEILGGKITFKQSFSNSVSGDKSSCSVGVISGEVYDYILSGSSLMIKTSTGLMINLKRISGDSESIVGSWSSRSYVGDQLVMRRMTFLSEDRLVLRTHCES